MADLTALGTARYRLVLGRGLRVCLIVMLCLAVGGQWAALQSVAWASMLVKYSARGSLAQAIAETFDGQHPCGLCRAVNAGQQAEKKPAQNSSPIVKHDLICSVRASRFVPDSCDLHFDLIVAPSIARADSPPVPPPRRVIG